MHQVVLGPLAALLALGAVPPQPTPTPTQVETCAREVRPNGNTLETIAITSWDRLGQETVRRAVVYSGQASDGTPAMYLRFVFPSDLSGSTLLTAIRETGAQMFLSLSGDPSGLKRILAGAGSEPPLFGTDLAAEDFRRLYGMNRPDRPVALANEEIDGRPTHVLRVEPIDPETSAYTSIVLHVDAESCLVVRAQFHDRPDSIRKELTVPAASLRRVGDGWVAGEVHFRDLRDGTRTRLVVDEIESGDRVRALPFEIPEDLPPVAAPETR